MDVVTSNTYRRVFEIVTTSGSGTAFTVDHAGRQWLVTARHLLPRDDPRPKILIHGDAGTSEELDLDLLPVVPGTADIAVSRLDRPLTPDHPLPPTSAEMVWSQSMFFLGFPYGMATELTQGPNRLAFVKSCILSATAVDDGVHLLYLDGMNNPGFSGGPVIFNRDGDSQHPQVCAVIAGFRRETQPVFQGTVELSDVTAAANSGIIVATDIMHAREAIEAAD
jgi:hypothetical protein